MKNEKIASLEKEVQEKDFLISSLQHEKTFSRNENLFLGKMIWNTDIFSSKRKSTRHVNLSDDSFSEI